ncbi:MAG: FkbM family methyltransferase [Nonlabens sp.]
MEAVKRIFRKLRSIYYHFLGGYPVAVKGERFIVRTKNIGFWKNVNRGDWEPESFYFLEEHLSKDDIYIDLGAWAGPTALYASRRCSKVIAFEPDPIAFKTLNENIQKNKASNIHSYNIAVAHYDGISTMSSAGRELGDTMTSLITDHTGKESFEALVLSWNTILETYRFGKVKMIKIDVEGAEFDLIPAMHEYLKKYRPILWLSIHPTFIPADTNLQQVEKLVDLLSFYEICINDNMQETTINEMLTRESLDGYPSFLLKMK